MKTATLTFEAPDRNQGQIVTISYATTPSGSVIEERFDGADRIRRYYWRSNGRKLTRAEMDRYSLTHH